MKAAVIDHYGPPGVLKIRETPRPAVKPDQVLVEVHASSVNPIDWKIRNGSLRMLMGFKFPMVLGYDVSGQVVEAGSEVTRFKIGDQVYAKSNSKTGRAYAEYVVVGESALALKPRNISHEEAAAIPLAALTALQALREQGGIGAGSRVLVIGAAGGVGSYAVQIAKACGAEVAGVCGTGNVALVKELGADRVIDYKKENVMSASGPYDIVFDAVAAYSFSAVRPILRKKGAYISTLPSPGLAFSILWTRLVPGQKAHFILMKPLGADLRYLAELVEAGKMRSVIDSAFSLEDVARAHARSEAGHARGKIVIRVKGAPSI